MDYIVVRVQMVDISLNFFNVYIKPDTLQLLKKNDIKEKECMRSGKHINMYLIWILIISRFRVNSKANNNSIYICNSLPACPKKFKRLFGVKSVCVLRINLLLTLTSVEENNLSTGHLLMIGSSYIKMP